MIQIIKMLFKKTNIFSLKENGIMVPEVTEPESGGSGEPGATPEPERGSDIPDAPFTG